MLVPSRSRALKSKTRRAYYCRQGTHARTHVPTIWRCEFWRYFKLYLSLFFIFWLPSGGFIKPSKKDKTLVQFDDSYTENNSGYEYRKIYIIFWSEKFEILVKFV